MHLNKRAEKKLAKKLRRMENAFLCDHYSFLKYILKSAFPNPDFNRPHNNLPEGMSPISLEGSVLNIFCKVERKTHTISNCQYNAAISCRETVF